jgi:heme-degrading monooxygenase HmoA
MILEIANLSIVPGQEAKFEEAFSEAKGLLADVPGFLGLELQKCIERPSRYALLARWRSVEDHTERFRGSAEYQRWKELLHHFLDPPPEVAHYRSIADV